VDDAFGDAAEKPAGDTAATSRADDDQVDSARTRQLGDAVGGIAFQDLGLDLDACGDDAGGRLLDDRSRSGELGTQRTLVVRVS
jgi:hypothetical protein